MSEPPIAEATMPETAILTYDGPEEILVKTSVTLSGRFDPAKIQRITVTAEDQFPFQVTIDPNPTPGQKRWSVALSEGFFQAGARWLRIQGLTADDRPVAQQIVNLIISDRPLSVGQALRLKILQPTWFKEKPEDASTLPNSQKIQLPTDSEYTINRYSYQDGHLLLELAEAIAPVGQVGYVYASHVTLTKGSDRLIFDPEDIPVTIPGTIQVLIQQDTLLKAELQDADQLTPTQQRPLLQGETLDILGYASLQGHFRITLLNDIPGFGRNGYLFHTHIQLQRNGKPIDFDPNALLLTIQQPTVFKKRPVNTSNLTVTERTDLPQGMVYGVLGYGPADEHIEITLSENLPGFGNTGYLFPDHVQLRRGSRIIDPLPDQIELNVPYHTQRNNTFRPRATCNVTALAMVLNYYGVRSRTGRQLEDELYQWCVRRGGPDAPMENLMLMQAARAYGFEASFATNRTWSQIQTQLRLKRPVIIGGYFTHGGHIICIIGFNRNGYLVHDPWGNALTGYRDTNGYRLLYPRAYMEKMCSPEGQGNIWAHFIAPKKS